MNNKKIVIGGAVVIGVAIIAIIVVLVMGKPEDATGMPSGSAAPNASSSEAEVLNRTAYETALVRAQSWQSDAALIKMVFLNQAGTAVQFTFVSAKSKGMGFRVMVEGLTVRDAEPVPAAGGGTALPANVISPDRAVAMARAVKGYEDASVVSVELLYNSAARQWYWGVKTDKGATITIKATR